MIMFKFIIQGMKSKVSIKFIIKVIISESISAGTRINK